MVFFGPSTLCESFPTSQLCRHTSTVFSQFVSNWKTSPFSSARSFPILFCAALHQKIPAARGRAKKKIRYGTLAETASNYSMSEMLSSSAHPVGKVLRVLCFFIFRCLFCVCVFFSSFWKVGNSKIRRRSNDKYLLENNVWITQIRETRTRTVSE